MYSQFLFVLTPDSTSSIRFRGDKLEKGGARALIMSCNRESAIKKKRGRASEREIDSLEDDHSVASIYGGSLHRAG